MENSNTPSSMAGHPSSETPQLPDEIILEIIKLSINVDSGSLRTNTSILRVSKKWNQLAQPVIWRDIVVENAVWPWVLSRLSRYTSTMTELQHLSVYDMSYRYPHHPDHGELAGEGLHDLLSKLPRNLQSLELVLLGIDTDEYSKRISRSLKRAMQKLKSLRLVAVRGTTIDALLAFAREGWGGSFPNLEQLSIVMSQWPQNANSHLAIRRFDIFEEIAKRIAKAKSNGRFAKLKLGQISIFDFHLDDFGKWTSNGHGKNTVHVFDVIHKMVVNSPLVVVNAGYGNLRLYWTQHITYHKLNGPSRAVLQDGWQDDIREKYRNGARLIAVIGTLEDLMDIWDGHQWVTTEQGVRVPRLALDGSLASRGLSVRQVDSTGRFVANMREVTGAVAVEFLRERDEQLDLRYVPDVYPLSDDDDDDDGDDEE